MLGQPVDVISLCSAAGDLNPLRLRLQSEEHETFRMNIDRVVGQTPVETVGAEGIRFLCRATAGDRQCLIELYYSTRTHSWRLLRCQDSFTTKMSPNIAMQP